MRHKEFFITDQRGAVAFEAIIVYLFMITLLLLPLADLAIAGLKFISAQQALRDMGQRTQYSPPGDVTSSASITGWKSALPATVDGYSVTAQVYCGNPGALAPCASGTIKPKYYIFSTSFTLSPFTPWLGSMLCTTCNVNYSLPFQ
jgi:hypothetical protein